MNKYVIYPHIVRNPPSIAEIPKKTVDANVNALGNRVLRFPTAEMMGKLKRVTFGIEGLACRRHVHELSSDKLLLFGTGKKDLWAAVLCIRDGETWAVYLPEDTYYFELLRQALLYGAGSRMVLQLIYWVYDHVGVDVNDAFAEEIRTVVWQNFTYCDIRVREFVRHCVYNALEHLYYGFVAENYYISSNTGARTMFGPSIKFNALLTMFIKLDFENVVFSANDSRGNSAKVCAELMERHVSLPAQLQREGVMLFQFGTPAGLDKLDAMCDKVVADWMDLVRRNESDDFGICHPIRAGILTN